MYRDIVIKKRHNGYAEVRSYMYEAIKARGQGIRFHYIEEGSDLKEVMTVPFNELSAGFVTARGIKSKVNRGQTFDLISFKWESDEDRVEREANGDQMTSFDFMN